MATSQYNLQKKTKAKKNRLDDELVLRQLVATKEKARAMIMARQVLVNNVPVDKPGTVVATDSQIRFKDVQKYVSRGGLKLEKALFEFSVSVKNKICLDVGISTGGFTDCLLQHGAKKVFGVDVGFDQLDWKLKTDARVFVFEKSNFRIFDLQKIPEPIDVVVMDVSFISLKKLIPKVASLFSHDNHQHTLIALIKPQFEVTPSQIDTGGIVRNAAVREKIVSEIKNFVNELNFFNVQITSSPITGADGNIEYLLVGDYKKE